MHHDRALNQATTSASVVAVMASLAPQHNLNSTKSRPRIGFTSRSLSQLPRFNDCYRLAEDNSSAAKEEMMALLRSGSRSTTSSAKSSTSTCHSVSSPATSPSLNPTRVSAASTPSTSPHKTPEQLPSPSSTDHKNVSTESMVDASFTSTNTLSPRVRRTLLRSARKIGNILGETPVLCTTQEGPDSCLSVEESSELAELGELPTPSSCFPIDTGNASIKRMNSVDKRSRLRPNAEPGLGMYDGLASAFVAPHQKPNLNLDHPPVTLNRAPPVLKVDCALVSASSKRARLGRSTETPDADAQSFVSTTTTSTMASDLFSPTTARRSPASPTGTGFVYSYSERSRDRTREMRRSKVAKLTRHLGERVPAELVFPETEPFVLVSYESASPDSPLASKTPGTPGRKVIEPPTRKSSLRKRTRKSLQLDLDRSPSTAGSSPSTGSVAAISPIGSTPTRYRPARLLTRSHSVRSRTRRRSSSSNTDGANERTHPASAPAIQTVYETVGESNADEKSNEVTEAKTAETQAPLSDVRKAINVKRAQKMLSVFGEAPPTALLSVMATPDVPMPFGRSPLAAGRFKRHSISSIMTNGSSFIGEPATFDSPITPITPRARDIKGEASATPTRNPSPKERDGAKLAAPATPRRRASLSALPATPPPFAQYFDPATPAPPDSPLGTPNSQQTRGQAPRTPRSPGGSPLAKHSHSHSPPTSSASSASPPTPGSGGKEAQDLGAVFRERRLRAAKLARFFGVGYGDLFPIVPGVGAEGDASLSSSSYETVYSVQRGSGEKEQRKDGKTKEMGVSVTVQREVDDGAGAGAERTSCESEGSSRESELGSLEMKQKSLTTHTAMNGMKTGAVPTDWDAGAAPAGCYGNLGFGTGLTPTRGASLRKRRGGAITTTTRSTAANANGAPTSELGSGGGILGGFSLGRQTRRPGGKRHTVVRDSLTLTLGRKGLRTGRCSPNGQPLSNAGLNSGLGNIDRNANAGVRMLTLGDRRSALMSSVGLGGREREPAFVRVGERNADVHEVLGRLRELR